MKIILSDSDCSLAPERLWEMDLYLMNRRYRGRVSNERHLINTGSILADNVRKGFRLRFVCFTKDPQLQRSNTTH